jgi:hypothetical protein
VKEYRRFRGFKSNALWRIFVTKREVATGIWRKLYDERIHNLWPLNIVEFFFRENAMGCIKKLLEKSEGERPIGRKTLV